MIYLCNTFITESKPPIGKGHVNRENLKSFTNFDIFKYSLASISKIYPWKRVIIYIKLDEIYNNRKNELEQFIKDEFSHTELILRWTRNERQADWIDTYELLNDRLIWFCCNHDHVFLDTDLSYFNNIIDKLYDEEEYCSLSFSHWPECIRTASVGKNYKIEHDLWVSKRVALCDSIQIITKELYNNWWLTGNFNEHLLPRPDYFGKSISEIKRIPEQKNISPLKEWCRHFDGYQHCQFPILNNKCPAIEIPTGFFESDINIAYGFDSRLEDKYTNLNPTIDNFFAIDKTGTDYKWNLEDIPLFWNSRIKSTSTSYGVDIEKSIQYRLMDILNMIHYNEFHVDKELENKIMINYLKNYKGYTLE